MDSLAQHGYSVPDDWFPTEDMEETGRFWDSYFNNSNEDLIPVQIQQQLLHSQDQRECSVPSDWLPKKAPKERSRFLNSYFYEEGSLSSIGSDMESDVFETPPRSSKNSEYSQRNSMDSLISIGTPPEHDSPGLPLTSPDFDLSLADIGEEVLPLTYLDPIEVIDGSKVRKSKKKRKKRSKRLASDEQIEQVDVDDVEVKEENADGDERRQGDLLKTERTELSQESQDSKRCSSKAGEPLSAEHESPEEDTGMLIEGGENDGDVTNTLVIPTESPVASADSLETPHAISRRNSRDSETMTHSSSVYDAFSRTNSTVSGGRGRMSRLKSTGNTSSVSSGNRTSVSSRQEKRKPIIRSPEKIFSGLDDELLRKLPSIKVQLDKLGVDLDAWKEGRKSRNSDVGSALPNDSEKGTTDFLSVVTKSPAHSRPTSSSSNGARSPRLSARKTEQQDVLMESANNLPPMQQDAVVGEHCASCGASLENIALHICLPPMSSRHRPKKAKPACKILSIDHPLLAFLQ